MISQIRQHLIAAQKAWKAFADTLQDGTELGWMRGRGFYNIMREIQPLEQVAYSVGKQVPYTLCVYCKRQEKDCSACNRSGWITEADYHAAPQDIRPEGSETYRAFQDRRGIAAA